MNRNVFESVGVSAIFWYKQSEHDPLNTNKYTLTQCSSAMSLLFNLILFCFILSIAVKLSLKYKCKAFEATEIQNYTYMMSLEMWC